MANGWNPLIGLGFTALGVGYLWEAYHRQSALTPLGSPVFGLSADGLRPNLPYARLEGKRLGGLGSAGSEVAIDSKGRKVLLVKDGVRTIQFYEAGDINRRLKFIIDQMKKASGDELGRRALELLVAEAYRKDALPKVHVTQILGLEGVIATDAFLSREKAWPPYTDEEIRQDIDNAAKFALPHKP